MSDLTQEAAPSKSAPGPISQVPTAAEKRRSRRLVLFTLLVVLVAGTGGLMYYRSKTPKSTGFQGFGGGRRGGFGMGATLPVVVNIARKGDINIILNGLGTVTPLATVTVTTQISGYLTEVNFAEGQLVNKGDLLAVIDPRPYAAALEQAQGQLLQAQAQFKEAQIDLDRYVTLSGQDSISKQQVDAQRALVSQYEGMVKQDQGIVDSAQLNLTYCHITAPVTGRVGLRLIDKGNYVTPNSSTGLVLLTQVSPITVIFTLPEDNIPQVVKQVRAPGSKVAVDAYNRDNTVKLATGVLSTIDNTVDPTTGTFKLRAEFPNTDEALFPNQFVNVSMLIDVQHGATVVSTSAIERGQQGSFVYVVGADNKVSAKTVTLGATEGERVAVLTGISPGDKVVVDGADRLKEGMDVDPQLPSQASGGGRGAGRSGSGGGSWAGRSGSGGGSWAGGGSGGGGGNSWAGAKSGGDGKLGPDGKPVPPGGDQKPVKPSGDSN
jgi:membrane fusion protein, multidrug efflux system